MYFLNKLKIVEEEADETLYWLEIFEESGMVEVERIKPIYNEVNEVLAIVVTSIRSMKNKINSKKA